MSRVTKPAAPRISSQASNAAGQEDDDADLAIKRAHTSVAQAGVHKPAGVANSVFDAGKLAKHARKKQAQIDPSKVVIEVGVPIPAAKSRATTAVYADLLSRMNPGDSVLLTTNQAKHLRSAASKRGFKFMVRAVNPEQARCWCMQRPQAQQVGA